MRKSVLAAIVIGFGVGLLPSASLGSPAPSTRGGQVGAEAVRPAAWILGDWQGTLRQAGVEPFLLEVTIASLEESSANVYSYTVINCSGVWEPDERRGATFRFLEVGDGGGGPLCNSTGEVTLVPLGDGRLHMTYHGGGVTSHGFLTRG
ncbi:MAG TPA: hypothetical protein VFZ64_10325 [Nocardioidaceae bacterium]